jgi:NADH dehydrogenase FAD-containing subunit
MTLPPECELSSSCRKLIHVEITDEHKKIVSTRDIPFDVVSIDIGSTTRDFNTIPGASTHCISTRPISDLIRKIELEEIKLKGRLR